MKQTQTDIWDTLSGRGMLLLWYLAVSSIYLVLNYPWGAVHSVALPLDALIPAVPVFVIPYLFFFFPWAAALLLWTIAQRPRVFARLIISLVVATLLSYVFYVLFQTVVYRPELTGNDVFTSLVRFVYHSDARYNAFPSTHTFTTVILLATTWPLLRRQGLRVLAAVVAGSIVLSTLLIKQHNIADVLLGIVIAVASLWVSQRAIPSLQQAAPPARGRRSERRSTRRAAIRQPAKRSRSRRTQA